MNTDYQSLPRLKDSISYVYLEHSIIEQEDASIVAIQKDGRIPVPVSSVTCLMLGPGTSITHAAIKVHPTRVGMNRNLRQPLLPRPTYTPRAWG